MPVEYKNSKLKLFFVESYVSLFSVYAELFFCCSTQINFQSNRRKYKGKKNIDFISTGNWEEAQKFSIVEAMKRGICGK